MSQLKSPGEGIKTGGRKGNSGVWWRGRFWEGYGSLAAANSRAIPGRCNPNLMESNIRLRRAGPECLRLLDAIGMLRYPCGTSRRDLERLLSWAELA